MNKRSKTLLPDNIKKDVAFQVKQLVPVSILKINQSSHIINVFSSSLLLIYLFEVNILILAICCINVDLMTLDSSIATCTLFIFCKLVIRCAFLVFLFAILLTLNKNTLEEKYNYLYILLS